MSESPTKEPENTSQKPVQKPIPLAIGILDAIQRGALDPLTLTPDKRQLCVRHMMHMRNVSHYEMCQILKVNASTITRDKQQIRKGNELSYLVIDEAEIAMDLRATADDLASRLVKNHKYKDAWTIVKECIEMLQSLGYVKKVEQKLNVKGKISLLEVLNLDFSDESGSEPGEEGHTTEDDRGLEGN